MTTPIGTFNPYGKLIVPLPNGQQFVAAATLPKYQLDRYWGLVADADGLPVPGRGDHFGPQYPQLASYVPKTGTFEFLVPEGVRYANCVKFAQPIGKHMGLSDVIALATQIAARDWAYNVERHIGPSRSAADAAVRSVCPTRLIGGNQLYHEVVDYINMVGEDKFNQPTYRKGSFLSAWEDTFFPRAGRDYGLIMALLGRFVDIVITPQVENLVYAG
jgi:hypothetical protein